MSSLPRVSVVVPAYNAVRTLAGCLESLLAQSYPRERREIVLVDDASSDGTAEVARRYAVTCLREPSRATPYAARNRGLRESWGEIVAFTDADCVADPGWLAEGVRPFADPTVGGVAGRIEVSPPVTVVERYQAQRGILSQRLALEHPVLPFAQTANAFYRRQVFRRLGAFEPRWVSAGDADLTWRMQLQTPYRLVWCPAAVVWHRHRSTYGGHFAQHRRWGIGMALLYAKHRREFRARDLGHGPRRAAWEYRSLLRALRRAAEAWWAARRGRAALEVLDFALLDLLRECGFRLGRLQGSLRARVFYP